MAGFSPKHSVNKYSIIRIKSIDNKRLDFHQKKKKKKKIEKLKKSFFETLISVQIKGFFTSSQNLFDFEKPLIY